MDYSEKKPKQKFTPEEDAKLTSYVRIYGTDDWNEIASFFDDRSARQLKERWFNYLDPNVDIHDWTPEEEELLLEKISQCGKKWRMIAQSFNGRTDVHLKNRYQLMKRRERLTGNIRLPQNKKDFKKILNDEKVYSKPIKTVDLLTVLPADFKFLDNLIYDDSL